MVIKFRQCVEHEFLKDFIGQDINHNQIYAQKNNYEFLKAHTFGYYILKNQHYAALIFLKINIMQP